MQWGMARHRERGRVPEVRSLTGKQQIFALQLLLGHIHKPQLLMTPEYIALTGTVLCTVLRATVFEAEMMTERCAAETNGCKAGVFGTHSHLSREEGVRS
jgi:hypothetical protein